MAFDINVNKALSRKLEANVIKQRTEAGFTLDYLEGWYVIDKLNEIFGFGSWSYNITELSEVSRSVNQRGNIEIGYRARVRLEVIGRCVVVREDVGFGNGISKQEFKAHENAGKEAVTDALKRACRTLGNVFGNTLYDKEKKGVINTELENKEAKKKILDIMSEYVQKSEFKNLSNFIKNNGIDISNDPKGALENEEILRNLITEYLENKPSSAFDSAKGGE